MVSTKILNLKSKKVMGYETMCEYGIWKHFKKENHRSIAERGMFPMHFNHKRVLSSGLKIDNLEIYEGDILLSKEGVKYITVRTRGAFCAKECVSNKIHYLWVLLKNEEIKMIGNQYIGEE